MKTPLLEINCKNNPIVRGLAYPLASALGLILAAFFVALVTAVAATAQSEAPQGRRHALVIGIDAYEHASDLANPVHDALAVAAQLESDGYELFGGQAHQNTNREEMLALFRSFANQLPAGAQATIFLAGHGLSHGGNTYLIPSDDDRLRTRADLADHGVPLRALTGRLAARPDVDVMLFIDACRANGLSGHVGSTTGGTADLVVGEGGAMALIYAAAPGQIAADGQGQNSPFTLALLDALRGLPGGAPGGVSGLFDTLAKDVAQRTEGAQMPFLLRSVGWR